MKYRFYVAYPEQEVHLRFAHDCLNGEWVRDTLAHSRGLAGMEVKGCGPAVLEQDGKDVVWFFCDSYSELLSNLKGKRVLMPHGAGFKNSFGQYRIDVLNRYFDRVFSSCSPEQDYMIAGGTKPSLIRPLGLPFLLDIPPLEIRPDAVLFGSTWFSHWNHHSTLERILRGLDRSLQGYVTTHPLMPRIQTERIRSICSARSNLHFIQSQEELLCAMAFCCAAVVGGPSTIASAFWFQRKPVLPLRGRVTRHPFLWFRQWDMIRRNMNYPLFDRVLAESTKIAYPWQFSVRTLRAALRSASGESIFFQANYDRSALESALRAGLENI